jgi:thioredoxin 1
MLANAITVTDATFEQEIEQSKGLTLVDFSATWCAPCRLIEPILDEIALARRGELKVATVDTDESIRTTARFQVRSAPTILFFKDGQLVDRIVGAVPRARIEAVIVKHA